MEELLKLFTTNEMTSASEQIKVSPQYLTNRYFKNKEHIVGENAEISIVRGKGIVLNSVGSDAEHIKTPNNKEYKISVSLPRYPLIDKLTSSDLNKFRVYNGNELQLEALTKKVGSILAKQKSSIVTSIENMAAGAIFGRVVDGNGKVLFELENKSKSVELSKSKSLLDNKLEIDKILCKELGTTHNEYTILCSPSYYQAVYDLAIAQDLFKTNQATTISSDDNASLVVHGVKYVIYQAYYENDKGETIEFIKDGEAYVVPDNTDIFKFIYGTANHTEAFNTAPTLIFSPAPEELPNGMGYSITSESRPLLYCERPEAIVKLVIGVALSTQISNAGNEALSEQL